MDTRRRGSSRRRSTYQIRLERSRDETSRIRRPRPDGTRENARVPFAQTRRRDRENELERVGRELRRLMTWIDAKEVD